MRYFKLVTFSALLVTAITFCPPMLASFWMALRRVEANFQFELAMQLKTSQCAMFFCVKNLYMLKYVFEKRKGGGEERIKKNQVEVQVI